MTFYTLLEAPLGDSALLHSIAQNSLIYALLLSSTYFLWSIWTLGARGRPNHSISGHLIESIPITSKDEYRGDSETRDATSQDEDGNTLHTSPSQEKPAKLNTGVSEIKTQKPRFNPGKYTVGWICAIQPEYIAARSLLDEKHDRAEKVSTNDKNIYTLGKMGNHYIVIGVMPHGEYGSASALGTAMGMLSSFPNVRIGLMVGIGGGAPSPKNDIRLGDVVVSAPGNGSGGVFQYDFGKRIQGQTFQPTGFLDQPPTLLLAAIADIQAEYKLDGHGLEDAISQALDKKPRLRKEYQRPSESSDQLFQSGVVHCETEGKSCATTCYKNPSSLVKRRKRTSGEDNPAIHYGVIASANQVMKDATIRDKLAAEKNIMCFEMEAAGLMNRFPCIVIRGICDYSDSHKNKEWQGYAAMVAATYAKDLLSRISPNEVEAERQISVVLESMEEKLDHIHTTAYENKNALTTITSDHQLAKIKNWLSPPDPSVNARLAKERRHNGTGTWIFDTPAFKEWKLGTRRHLWLYSRAGCGKTVLSATILDHLLQSKSHNTLYFFFDFNDSGKQTLRNLQCSLAFQLYCLWGETSKKLDSLYVSHDNGKKELETSALSEYIKSEAERNRKTYILIDALDECTTKEQDVLGWLEYLASGNSQLIVTGRPEAEFRRGIPSFFQEANCILLDNNAINIDIQSYVTARLEQDFKGQILSQDLQHEIRDKVGNGADGMFRWAACQLDSLARCLSAFDIKVALESLPKDLNETYDRMFEGILEEYRSGAIRLLQFLVYTKRPMKLLEAVEVIATEMDKKPYGFHEDRRLYKPGNILKYCPGFISVTHIGDPTDETAELHLTHFSVKEYLINIKKDQFSLESASIVITKTCLTYLTEIENLDETNRVSFPMARYAAEFWMYYAKPIGGLEDIIDKAVIFLQDATTFQRWCRLYQADQEWLNDPGPPRASNLYYACLGGLVEVVRKLVSKVSNINAREGFYGSALCAASARGHQETVQLLLHHNAKINAQIDNHGNALQVASREGCQEIVQLLIDRGADIDAQGGDFNTALCAASARGRREIVQLLINCGANVNAQNKYGSDALKVASMGGYKEIVELLLKHGADIDADEYKYGNALYIASKSGHPEIVQLLIDRGADVNTQGGYYGNALQAASARGHRETVQLLIDNKANINTQGGDCGNALYAASAGGHQEIVQLLIDNGADINAEGGDYGNCLQAALEEGHQEIVQLLIDNGADINAEGGDYGNCLQAAFEEGHQ